jgi:RNA polymerase sigma-70 factor (ECF subfamily)
MRRYGPMVLGTCQRVLGRGPDAEDAFQATFLILACKATQVRQQTVGGWLHRVAYRAAVDVLSSANRRKLLEPQAHPMPSPDPAAEATWNEIRPILDAELHALPDQPRQLLIACYLEGQTHAQAARALGIPLGSLAWHLDRARGLLAERLARRGVAVSAALLAILLTNSAHAARLPAVLLVHTLNKAAAFAAGAGDAIPAHLASLVQSVRVGMETTWTRFGLLLACCLTLGGAGL